MIHKALHRKLKIELHKLPTTGGELIIQCKKTMTYDVGNPGLGLEQTQICGGVKLDSGIPTIPS